MHIINRILAIVRNPIAQSLALLLATVFVLGCKAAATDGVDSPLVIRATTALLTLYMFKAINVLYRENKEVSDVRRTHEQTADDVAKRSITD